MIGKDFISFTSDDWPGGHHDRSGFFSGIGKGIKTNESIQQIEMCDVLPTLLTILDMQTNPSLEGVSAPLASGK